MFIQVMFLKECFPAFIAQKAFLAMGLHMYLEVPFGFVRSVACAADVLIWWLTFDFIKRLLSFILHSVRWLLMSTLMCIVGAESYEH